MPAAFSKRFHNLYLTEKRENAAAKEREPVKETRRRSVSRLLRVMDGEKEKGERITSWRLCSRLKTSQCPCARRRGKGKGRKMFRRCRLSVVGVRGKGTKAWPESRKKDSTGGGLLRKKRSVGADHPIEGGRKVSERGKVRLPSPLGVRVLSQKFSHSGKKGPSLFFVASRSGGNDAFSFH